MKGSLTVVAFFCAGCLMGVANDFQFDLHDLSMYVLYALMFQVGIGIGSNKKLKELVKSLRPKSAFGADGHHCGNAVVLRLRQSAVEPMECVRLHGGG